MDGSVEDYFRRGSKQAQTRPIFTNRVAELRAFQKAVVEHEAWRADIDPLDPDVGRRNVVNFFGIGGIGKSTLLQHLAEYLESNDRSIATVTIDFEDTASYDIEQLLLRIRNAVGQHGKRCIAFDFAFAFYWEIAHPGTSIESYTSANNWFERASKRIGLSSAIEASVMDVVSSIVSASQLAHGATRLAHAVGKILHDRTKVKHAIAGCEVLPLFLDASRVMENISYLPSLLAWDLRQAGSPPVVVFLDTYEELTARGRKLEKIVQRIVYLLPNVLFVIAGRNRLDWHKPALLGSLDYAGEHCWPLLVGDMVGSGYVCAVGDLDERDADAYLRERLVLGGQSAIPDHVRSRIVAASQGWPLYLHIAVVEYQQALHESRIDDANFGGAFPALISRITQDMDYNERKVLRSASMLPGFDVELVRAGASGVDHATVQRFLARGFVKLQPAKVRPYSLHSALRATLLKTQASDELWEAHDWRAAAARLLSEMESRVRSGARSDEIAQCLSDGLALCAQYRLDAEWLSMAARHVACTGGLVGIRLPEERHGHAGALSDLLECINTADEYRYSDRPALFEECMSDLLSPFDRFWCRSLQADSWMSAGLLSSAEGIFEEILRDPIEGELGDEAFTMYALLSLKRGRFASLLEYAAAHEDRVNAFRIRGDVYRLNARWEAAGRQYREGLRQAELIGDVGLASLFRAELALVDGWEGINHPGRWSTEGAENSAPWDEVTRQIAHALFLATEDRTKAYAHLDRASNIAQRFDFQEAGADIHVARAFIGAIDGDGVKVARSRAFLHDFAAESGTYSSWLAVIAFWQEEDMAGEPIVEWLGGNEDARRRWRETLDARRRRTGGDRCGR